MIEQVTHEQTETQTATPKYAPDLTEEQAKEQARSLKALSDPTRLRILSLLSKYAGLLSVQDIVSCFRLEQPTISHHLRILLQAGFIDCQKQSLYVYYYLKAGKLNDVWRGLLYLEFVDPVE